MSKIRVWGKANQNKIWAWLIGIGLVFFAIHNPNQPLKEYAFLPVVGLAISLIVIMLVLSDNWRRLDFGSKWIWIPLVCIGGSIAMSGFVNGESLGSRVAPLLFAFYLFGVYLVGRILKDELFAPFSFAVVVGAVGCVVYGLLYPGQMTGGFISPTNYDIAAGLMIFGVVVGIWKWRWWLSAIALVGLFFCGAPEGLFGISVLLVAVLIRRDWSKKILLPLGIVALVAVAWFSMGYGQSLYSYTVWQVTGEESLAPQGVSVDASRPMYGLAGRWEVAKIAMSDINLFGHEYTITNFNENPVHNVPLVIVEQVGVLAGVAWLFLTIFCLIKTKWKYAWIAVIALSMFDHFMWTQVAPWFWVLVGVSTASTVKSDLIFKKAEND